MPPCSVRARAVMTCPYGRGPRRAAAPAALAAPSAGGCAATPAGGVCCAAAVVAVVAVAAVAAVASSTPARNSRGRCMGNSVRGTNRAEHARQECHSQYAPATLRDGTTPAFVCRPCRKSCGERHSVNPSGAMSRSSKQLLQRFPRGTASYASQEGAAAFDTGRWAGLRTIHFGAGDASIQYRVLLGRRCRGGAVLTIAVWRRKPTLL